MLFGFAIKRDKECIYGEHAPPHEPINERTPSFVSAGLLVLTIQTEHWFSSLNV